MDVRRVIGYVPQILSADGQLTGYENLLVFAKLYDVERRGREERLREALEVMGLSDAADRLVRTYSGGMIRRLEIAQSMLGHKRGGAAKMGVLGSSFFGMLSGSTVSNVLTIGSMTIPAMKQMAESLGHDKFLALLRDATARASAQQAEEWARKQPKRDMETWIAVAGRSRIGRLPRGW
jgi:hypothetical protein